MDLIPEEELRPKSFFNLTPMVDFLFLVVAIFAILAMKETTLFDSEVTLAKVEKKEPVHLDAKTQTINLCVTKEGQYKWVSDLKEHPMSGTDAILKQLADQKKLGLISENVPILIHIDAKAEWNCVVNLLYSLKKNGYTPHPVYQMMP
jgi:biopolymer transport protein ExbD